MNVRMLTPIAALCSLAIAMPAVGQDAATIDIVIKGGTIYDGSSVAPVVGDVAIAGDKIVYIGPTMPTPYPVTARTIDARGLIVAPGFIDPHTHAGRFLDSSDATERLNLPWMMQGVTTIFAGVDGGGQTDVAGFFRDVETRGFGSNVAAYIGFGPVRRAVLGDDGRAPTEAELGRMKSLVAQGMCDGALGLSTGLFYAPQSFAKTEEVIALAREAAVRGGVYDTHQRDESTYSIGVADSVREAIAIGKAADMPVHFAHIKTLGVDVHGKADELIAIIEAARAEGQAVTADQYPWEASGTGLEAALLPRWAVDGGRDAMLARFAKPNELARIKAAMAENLRRRGGAPSLLLTARDRPWTAKRLSEVAAEWNVAPVEAALRIISQDAGGTSLVSFNMAETDIRAFMQRPWVVTSSDGSHGHPRMYATFPQKYAQYVRAKKVIDLATFINSSTGRTADIFKLDRRGHIRPGYYADVVVFDPDGYTPVADYIEPERLTTGVRTLVVNGRIVVSDGQPTGVAAGRALRHVPPAESCAR